MMRSWKAALAAGMVLAAATQAGCVAAWLPAMARWLDVGGEPAPADIVCALPGDNERRPFVAAALVKVGLAGRAAIVENAPSPDVLDGVDLADHLVVKRIYQSRGLTPDQILMLPGHSTSTADDLAILQQYLEDRPEERACVVTSACHTRRTRWTVWNRLADHFDRVSIVSAPNPGFGCDNWWRTSRGLKFVLSEYGKLAWYAVRYGHYGTLAGLGLALLVLVRPARRYLTRMNFKLPPASRAASP